MVSLKKDWCVSPLLFVKGDSSLKEGNGQMFIFAYASIKSLRNRHKRSLPLEKNGKPDFSFNSDLHFQTVQH